MFDSRKDNRSLIGKEKFISPVRSSDVRRTSSIDFRCCFSIIQSGQRVDVFAEESSEKKCQKSLHDLVLLM